MSKEDPTRDPDGARDSEGAVLERLRDSQLWIKHVEELLAKRSEQVDVWRARAEERQERISVLEKRLRNPLARLRAWRNAEVGRPPPAPVGAGATTGSTRSNRVDRRMVHPSVRLAVVATSREVVPPLLNRLNAHLVDGPETQGNIVASDIVVIVGSDGADLAQDLPSTREWIESGQPVVEIGTPGGVQTSELDYFDEADDVFASGPATSSFLDHELHPTQSRTPSPTSPSGGITPTESDVAASELETVAKLRTLRSTASAAAVSGRFLAGGGVDVPRWEKEALAVLLSRRADFVVGAVEQMIAQTYRPLRLSVGLHREAASAETDVRNLLEASGVAHSVATFGGDTSQGECLNRLIADSPGDVVMKIDDDDLYSPVYIEDMVGALNYSGAPIVGKAAAFVRLTSGDHVLLRNKAYSEVDHVVGPTITAHRHVWETVRFPHRHSRVDSTFLQAARSMGFSIVSHHPWDFCVIRHDAGHSWTATDNFFEAMGRPVEIDWDKMQSIGSRMSDG